MILALLMNIRLVAIITIDGGIVMGIKLNKVSPGYLKALEIEEEMEDIREEMKGRAPKHLLVGTKIGAKKKKKKRFPILGRES